MKSSWWRVTASVTVGSGPTGYKVYDGVGKLGSIGTGKVV